MGMDRVHFAPKNIGSDIIATHVHAVQNAVLQKQKECMQNFQKVFSFMIVQQIWVLDGSAVVNKSRIWMIDSRL